MDELDHFDDLLRRSHLRRDEALRERFDRSLPLADGHFDRWERARRLGFGEGASIYDSASVFGEVVVGAHTWVGPNTMLDGSGGRLAIGAWCSISTGVHLYTHDTMLRSLSMGVQPRRTGPVSVGDGCYLGSQSIVAAGVTIGSQCVVAANSFVRGDVPDRSVVGGSPAVPIGRVKVGPDGTVEVEIAGG